MAHHSCADIPAAEVRQLRGGLYSYCHRKLCKNHASLFWYWILGNRCSGHFFQAVLVPTEALPDTAVVRGYDFTSGRDLDGIMDAMLTTGFQATSFGQAVQEVNRMVRWV
jgi:hypothetical protein